MKMRLVHRTFEAIGILTFIGLVLFQYAPGIADRLGLPSQSAYECPGTFWRLPGVRGWIRCDDLDLHHRLKRRGLTQQAAALVVEKPTISP